MADLDDLDDPLGKAQRRGDTWKRMALAAQADRDRAEQALAQAEQRARTLDTALAQVRRTVTAWKRQLPDTIRTETAVDAIRTALKRADTAPPLDHTQILDRAVLRLQSIPIQCTALTGPVWYGEGWKGAIRELEEYADQIRPAPTPVEPQES
jgi:hypothetical protein